MHVHRTHWIEKPDMGEQRRERKSSFLYTIASNGLLCDKYHDVNGMCIREGVTRIDSREWRERFAMLKHLPTMCIVYSVHTQWWNNSNDFRCVMVYKSFCFAWISGKWCPEGNSKCLVELYFRRCYNITLANIELLKSVLWPVACFSVKACAAASRDPHLSANNFQQNTFFLIAKEINRNVFIP